MWRNAAGKITLGIIPGAGGTQRLIRSQRALMMIKEAINRGFATALAEGARFERRHFYSLFATEDQKEGMSAPSSRNVPQCSVIGDMT